MNQLKKYNELREEVESCQRRLSEHRQDEDDLLDELQIADNNLHAFLDTLDEEDSEAVVKG